MKKLLLSAMVCGGFLLMGTNANAQTQLADSAQLQKLEKDLAEAYSVANYEKATFYEQEIWALKLSLLKETNITTTLTEAARATFKNNYKLATTKADKMNVLMNWCAVESNEAIRTELIGKIIANK